MNNEARFNRITTVGLDQPTPAVFIPLGTGYFCLHQRIGMQIIFFGYHTTIIKCFRRIGIFLLRGKLGFFQQGEIDVRLDVARSARIPVPIPRAAKVAALFDNPEIINAGLAQARRSQHAAKAASDNRHFNLILNRPALKRLVDIWIVDKISEIALDLLILVIAVSAYTLVALGFVFQS